MSFPARRRGLGRNAGGIRSSISFAEFGADMPFTSYNNLEYNTTEYYDIDIMTKAIFSKDHKYTVEQLKKARLEAGLDQIEVAKLLSKTQPHISKIEAGQRRLDITQLKEFAKIYKKDLSFFIK
jgi:DNA-binding transcriptional regulator YiaG